ncbi:hypothetical protein SynSYN20_00779 [Synechococcus sp. SYN20]|nr:hypothetical protein SynSYN20_00779 [Synechococcus sp. SYN20]
MASWSWPSRLPRSRDRQLAADATKFHSSVDAFSFASLAAGPVRMKSVN